MASSDDILAKEHDAFAAEIIKVDPDFFIRTAGGQDPKILWIGCADSRVPEWTVYGAHLGEVFVHRNIANQFHLNDISALAVLEYALEHLNVEHVLIVGHTDCGGVKASLPTKFSLPPPTSGTLVIPPETEPLAKIPEPESPLEAWLTDLRNLGSGLDPSDPDALQKLTHLNVSTQFKNVCITDILRRAWESGKNVWVHGWIYHIESGEIEIVAGPRTRPPGFGSL